MQMFEDNDLFQYSLFLPFVRKKWIFGTVLTLFRPGCINIR